MIDIYVIIMAVQSIQS